MIGDSIVGSLSFRLQGVGMRELMAQRRHDLRIGKQPAYIDQAKKQFNKLVFADGRYVRDGDFRQADTKQDIKHMKWRMKDARRDLLLRVKRRTKKAAYWRTAILTFSKSAQPSILEKPVHEEAKAIFESFADRHGVKLLWVAYHGDETAPHYHAAFTGLTSSGYALRLNRTQLSTEQDTAASFLSDRGITRGKPKNARKAEGEAPSKYINRTVKELHDQLPAELEAAHEKLAKNQRLLRKANADLVAGKVDAEKLLKRIDAYERRALAAEEKVVQLTKTIDEMEESRKFLQEEIEEESRHLEYEKEQLSYAESQAEKAYTREASAIRRINRLDDDAITRAQKIPIQERRYERAFAALVVAAKSILPAAMWDLIESAYHKQLNKWIEADQTEINREAAEVQPSTRYQNFGP